MWDTPNLDWMVRRKVHKTNVPLSTYFFRSNYFLSAAANSFEQIKFELKSWMVPIRVTRLGHFWKILATQMILWKWSNCLGYCEKWHFLSKTAVTAIRATFGDNWVTFYFTILLYEGNVFLVNKPLSQFMVCYFGQQKFRMYIAMALML